MEILDDQVRNEGDMELIQEMSSLAEQCLNFRGDERPTMKEVAEELGRLRKFKQHPWRRRKDDIALSILALVYARPPVPWELQESNNAS
ncbi:hypothetical protein B296_00015905 [Ensete ventricosum]|uniref:Serine-threonine/tyrosine-protein kinase catalytic domain-containing protein n=1 Tax=Ensete ventricosum TaxID=4639 RepID=A0A426Z2S6_ENSVE|nr:hypothetical protein B296_00015905 [Ensete ventricosum]